MLSKLSFLEKGKNNNIPFIFLHAFPFNKEMWKKQLEGLSKHVFLF